MTYEPNTPEVLADTWAKLLKDPDKIAKMAKEGRKGVEEHFNIYDQGEKLIKIYETLRK